jgi:hypothetical protein
MNQKVVTTTGMNSIGALIVLAIFIAFGVKFVSLVRSFWREAKCWYYAFRLFLAGLRERTCFPIKYVD